ncbi:EcsC family protein [Falsibacillus albus]|uniref:EcsC family protein n=1 Tax=Falsibacillus albus TaxID=2478915 RepID=A0A3L7K4U4_9BACI|nr:EcsC family protein [Falsibacillus albus]RLQ97289.1 EcsC family protein [Falsibacillus albus]
MNNSDYVSIAKQDTERWKKKINTRSSMIKRMAKRAQEKVNSFIPEKIHHVVTESIKKMVQITLFGSEYLTKTDPEDNMDLEAREKLIKQKINAYKKTAALEGAGTGAGGIILGMADFPLLLSIKMKLLFEIGAQYGHDIKRYEERMFILHVFQLAFSSDEKRLDQLSIIENWEQYKNELDDLDWRQFQQEYRDYIDFAKLLQLVPGIGAFVGAYANYSLLEYLGDTAIQAYRLRYFNQ